MSKLNIGVGDEFPLDESPAREHRHGRRRRHHRHHIHHHFHPHHHRRHGFAHVPLLILAVAIAAAIGAGKIPPFAGHPVLIAVGAAILLMMLARVWMHRRWRRTGA